MPAQSERSAPTNWMRREESPVTTAWSSPRRRATPPPRRLRRRPRGRGSAARRGQALFESARAGCTQCHGGALYTSSDLHDVGLGKAGDRYPSFSVPTLVAGFRKTAWLHNARARSLEKLLAGPHSPEKVIGAEPLSPAEIDDLVAFLKSL